MYKYQLHGAVCSTFASGKQLNSENMICNVENKELRRRQHIAIRGEKSNTLYKVDKAKNMILQLK